MIASQHHPRHPPSLQVPGTKILSPRPRDDVQSSSAVRPVKSAIPQHLSEDGDDQSIEPTMQPHMLCSAVDIAHRMSPDELSHFNRGIAQYLTAYELQSLRLVGGRDLNLTDPSLTSHLQLRMDRAPFFQSDSGSAQGQAEKWLSNRRRLAIHDADACVCPNRVVDLIADGYLDSVSEVTVFNCHAHREIIASLSGLSNLESLVLSDHECDEDQVLEDLECIAARVGQMKSLKQVDIQFDCTVHGSRLSFLRNWEKIERLRLRGFDLSYGGINYLKRLSSLTSLHLCHGSVHSSPSNDVNEEDLLNLVGLPNLQHIHLEAFDGLSNAGLKFCHSSNTIESLVLKHCQSMSEECLPTIGRMENLTSLHLVHSAYDGAPILDAEGLRQLNSLSSLKRLSLFYMLADLSDLGGLWGLSQLETLNIAVEDGIESGDLDYLCQSVLPVFPCLRKLRIFSEDGTAYTCRRESLEVEFATFNFGDEVYLD